MIRHALCVAALAASSQALAQESQWDEPSNPPAPTSETDWARDAPRDAVAAYTSKSVSLIGTPFGTQVGFYRDGANTRPSVAASITVRACFSGFLLQAGLAGGLAGRPYQEDGILLPSLGVGYAFRLGPRVALSAMATGAMFIPLGGYSSGVAALVGVELPFTIFLGRNGFIEPYVAGTRYVGGYNPTPWAASLGLRVGVMLDSVLPAEEPDAAPARHYTKGVKVALLGGGELANGGLATGAYGRLEGTYNVSADVRIAIDGFLVEPTFRLVHVGDSEFTVVPGLGLGYAFALGSRVALSPTLRGSVILASTWNGLGLGAIVGVDVPLTIFIGRHAFIEPYVTAGLLISSRVDPTVGVGYRLGVVF